MSKKVIVLFASLLVCAGVLVMMRIGAVNASAPSVPRIEYQCGDVIDLEGSFMATASENTQGYSLVVNGARLSSYGDYLARYGCIGTDERHEGVGDDEASSVVDVEITLANKDNRDGYLALWEYRLVPETGNEFYAADPGLWSQSEKNVTDVLAAFTVLPGTSYTTHIPFVATASDDQLYQREIEGGSFRLVVADGPVRREVMLEAW